MTLFSQRPFRAAFGLLAVLLTLAMPLSVGSASASEIRYVVNDIPVTSYDIQRRAAFMRLQQRKGGAGVAEQEMIDQALRMAEVKRLGIKLSDQQIDDAYTRFAQSNKIPVKQMDQILAQTGVTKAHFKDYIRAQMAWNTALGGRFRQSGGLSEQDVVRRMLEQGGPKPSATEYMLQQVIFVVPAAERKATLAKRKREAEAMRQRFSGCKQTREFVKGLIDVTVRDLGRVLAPELPTDWADLIKSTQPGGTTKVRETERGIEFIGVCSSREVSDDRVAQMVFQGEVAQGEEGKEIDAKYMDELRKKARIVKR
ncbi:MAG: SurA N-terminal domain-containing protein [Rhizobiaceae bacterium]